MLRAACRGLSALRPAVPALLPACRPFGAARPANLTAPAAAVAVAQQRLRQRGMSSSAAAASGSGATAGTAAGGSAMPSPSSAIDFLMLLTKLKITKRTGWVRCNVQQPESIADHMYRMGMMSLILGDGAAAGVDAVRCMKIALVHDVAESLVGDITPHCGVSDDDKHRMEAEAVGRIQEMLGKGTQAAADVAELWREYESQATRESHLVKDFDKLEMIIQAHEYEQAQGIELQQFFDSTAGKFKTETGRAWAAELVARRQAAKTSS